MLKSRRQRPIEPKEVGTELTSVCIGISLGEISVQTYEKRLYKLVAMYCHRLPLHGKYVLITHHLFMGVPCYNLPRANALLIEKGYGPRMTLAKNYGEVIRTVTQPVAA